MSEEFVRRSANHTFGTPGIDGDSATPPVAIITDAVTTWATQLLAPAP
jgi:hypothetical protein